jgi:hypothetical protein
MSLSTLLMTASVVLLPKVCTKLGEPMGEPATTMPSVIVSVCGTFENLMRQNARIFSSESYAAQMRPIAKWPHSQKILWLCCKMPAYACRMPHTHIPHTETMPSVSWGRLSFCASAAASVAVGE